MITKETIKSKIDRIDDQYLSTLYRIIQSFEVPPRESISPAEKLTEMDWHAFIKSTYGCLADDPISRPDQGEFELREALQ